jgi:hypothetical protein
LDHIIIKINNILSINFEEHYHKYKEHYACELNKLNVHSLNIR